MSSKLKSSKFKNAVSASQSSSRSSSPAPSSSSSLSISEQNTLQALHQEQLARLASASLPRLAALHSRRFLRLAREHVQSADALWTNQKLQPTSYRRALWAEDIEPSVEAGGEGDGRKKGKRETRTVPDFYHRHNPRCASCALPLIPGINLTARKTSAKPHTGQAPHRKRKRTPACTLCDHKYP